MTAAVAELQSYLPVIDLARESVIVLEAIDPVSGAQVTGVTVANVAITYEAGAGGGEPVSLPALLGYNPGPN